MYNYAEGVFLKNSTKVLIFIKVAISFYILFGTAGACSILKQGVETSFPWWSSFVLMGYFFGPLIIISLIIYFIFKHKEKSGK